MMHETLAEELGWNGSADEVNEPRTWGIDASEPSDVRYVRDRYGCLFEKFADNVWHRWRAGVGRFGEADWTWSELASDLPVEVLGTPLELTPPVPAEPAEEETKAEVVQDIEVMQWDGTRKSIQAICDWVNSFDDELDDPTISYCFSSAAPDDVLDVSLTTNEGDFVRVSDGDFIVRDLQGNFYRRDRDAYATVAASSPVVPAPAETGPWMHRVNGEICVASPASGLPYTIGKFNDHGDFVWHSSSAELPEGFAPFVAAEEG